MKKVFIKYNPYKLTTEIMVDGKMPKDNSPLREKLTDGSRLQEWVEELPDLLSNEYNVNEFEVTFNGTRLDYEDINTVFDQAQNDTTKYKLEYEPAKESADKETLIDNIFKEIQKGPFEELRGEEIINAFNLAKSSDFELCVVATMSAGKSTLINAMLGTKLLPSKQEACTAVITRIKDDDEKNDGFVADVYDKKGDKVETCKPLTPKEMEELNKNVDISEIKISGNIPFVTSEDISLVMIDTPGPNNSRDLEHKRVQSALLDKSSKALVLYVMTGQFATDDDNVLLKRVAESMTVGGKQAKDRFIFVVNKLDALRGEDGDTKDIMNNIRSYLRTHDVINPNLFPVGALPALMIRQYLKQEIDDGDGEMNFNIKKFNRNSGGNMHLEEYASLPKSLREKIEHQLDEKREEWEGENFENPEEALIHTGIVSIEAAIRQYVQKYAKTAKIKNIADTFIHKLDEVGCFEQTKKELAANQNEKVRIVSQIETIENKVKDVKEAVKYKENVADTVEKTNNGAKEIVEKIREKFQTKISEHMRELKDSKLDRYEAQEKIDRIKKIAEELEQIFRTELEKNIHDVLVDKASELLKAYKEKLISLTEEIDMDGISSINIDPLKLMSGSSIVDEGFNVNNFIKEEEISCKNYSKKWYKPWTWPQADNYFLSHEYIDGSYLAREYSSAIQINFHKNCEAAEVYASQQIKVIEDRFNAEFKRLDGVLQKKLAELKSYATDETRATERIKESERKLEWLMQIKEDVESILEI